MAKISVIVPVYNVEKYLDKCLSSLINQTYKDVEIILINDGSQDSSLEICQAYREKDSRIVIVNQSNKGPSAARNAGIMMSTSEYITFVDSDDWIDKSMLEKMISAAEDSRADLVLCGMIDELDGDKKAKCKVGIESGYYNEIDDLILEFICPKKMTLPIGPVCKLYRRKLIISNDIKFREDLHYGEDYVFNIEYLLISSSIYSLNEDLLYFYRNNQKSLTYGYRKNLWNTRLKIYNYLKQILIKKNNSDFLNRLNGKMILYAIGYIINETNYKSARETIINIREILHDETLDQAINTYPISDLPFKARVLAYLIKFKKSWLLLCLIKIRNFLRFFVI